MALFEASDFSGYSSTWAVPAGEITPLFTGSVDLVMTTNVTQVVFDTLSTALKCIHYMSANDLYRLSPNEDITIINLRSKLLILENTYINQKLLNHYVFKYDTSGNVQAVSRNTSVVYNLEEALTNMGFRCVQTPWGTDSNAKMNDDRSLDDKPHIIICDYK